MRNFLNGHPGWTAALLVILLAGAFQIAQGQMQSSAGGVTLSGALPAGSNVIGGVTQSGTWNVGAVTSITNALPTGANVIGAVTQSGTWTLGAATNIIGLVRVIPGNCTQTTLATFTTVGVATGAGTAVTATTSCVAGPVYANNITNSAVTLRLADKTGTPVIWIGGNADFSIPANSNVAIHLEGLVFTSGITAIAGAASAINLYVPTLQ